MKVAKRRRTLVTLGVALALLLVASWLAFDRLLPGARATTQPASTQGAQDPGSDARGRRPGSGLSGVTAAPSGHAGRDDFGPVRGVDASSEILGPSFADATDYRGTVQNGERSSNPTQNGSTPSGVGTTTGAVASGGRSGGLQGASGPAAAQSAGADPSTDVSAVSDVLLAPVGPVIGAAAPGVGTKTGFDNPDHFVTGWGSGDSRTVAGTDVPPNPVTVPAPPSLFLFGASALTLWVLSRMRRGAGGR